MIKPLSSIEQSAHDRVVRARISMVMAQPFFASLALRLKVTPDPSCHTAWTDGRVFAYNPSYISTLPRQKLIGLCAHTVMHPACGHHIRRGSRDKDLWNRACDYAVNPILLDAGMDLPDGFLFDDRFRNKSADAVYQTLADEKNEEDRGGQVGDPNSEALKETDPEQGRNPLPLDDPGNTGQDENQEDPGTDPGMAGEVRDLEDAPGTGEDEDIDWDQALVQAAANARRMGKLPKGLERLVQERINPKLGWRQLLSRFIQNSARSDYSWTTPNRRYIHQNLYFPSLNTHELSELAVALDTSGSVLPEELDQFAAELSAILECFPSKLHLLYTDMAVNRYQVFNQWDLPIKFEPKGGGGTDFRPAFEFIADQRVSPACLIYLTDLECKLFPSNRPPYPVLWVKTGPGGAGPGGSKPPFGNTICLES